MKTAVEPWRLHLVGRDQKIFAAVIGSQVALIATLRRQHKIVDAVTNRQIADIVGDHAIQPANAVPVTDHQLGLPTHVEYRASLQESLEFSRGIAKRGRGLAPAIGGEPRSRFRQLVLERSNTHGQYLIIRSGLGIVGRR